MRASDILSADVVTLTEHTSVADAVELLKRLEFRQLPVLREDGDLMGLLTDFDVWNASTEPLVPTDSDGRPQTIVDLMSTNVPTIHAQTSVREIMDLMIEEKVGALPVVEPTTGELIGMVSFIDVFRALRSASTPELRLGAPA